MQPTMELAELDELVEQLDARITEVDVAADEQTPSLLLCSFQACQPYPWSWYC